MQAVVNQALTIPMYFEDATGTGKTGLTVAAAARLSGSTTTVSGTVTERTGGDYDAAITLTSVGTWLFKGSTMIDGDAALWTETVEVVTAAQADPAASITASGTTVVNAVATSGRITLVRGDDYLNADGRALSWTVSSPNLTGASATLTIRTYAGATVLAKAMTVVGATTVRADLTHTETAAMALGTPAYTYEIVATLSGGGTATIASGTVWITD